MLNNKLQVLGIDDHPIVLEGYNYMFTNLEHGFSELNFTKAFDCESGYNIITGKDGSKFDLALIDYSIPAYPEENLYSGKDLGILLRQNCPNCKIIMLTMHKEIDIIFNIFDTINPEGFINKSDCTTDELMFGFKEVLSGNTFYSTVINTYRNQINKGMVLDDIDVRIIRFLARRMTDRSLNNYIPLSYKEIEKRKKNIMDVLGITGSEEDLVNEARVQGYI